MPESIESLYNKFYFLPARKDGLPPPNPDYLILIAERFVREHKEGIGPAELVEAVENLDLKRLKGTKYEGFVGEDIKRVFELIKFNQLLAREEERKKNAPQREAERAGRLAEREAQRIADLMPQFHGSFTEQTTQLEEFVEAAKAKRTNEMRRDFLKINGLYEKIDSIIKGQQGSENLKKDYEGWTDQNFKQFSDQLDAAYTILADLLRETEE